MASKQAMVCVSLPANADLSTKQNLFVVINSSGNVAVAGDGADADGVLMNEPAAAGRAAEVAISGIVPVLCGGTVTAGDQVSSSAAGKAVTAGTGDYVLGRATETGADGEIIGVLLGSRQHGFVVG
jgi:hypothetical protein